MWLSPSWCTATRRPRTLPEALSGEDRSSTPRRLPQEPTLASAEPWNCAVGFLRTMLTMPDGSPAPVVRPEAPRSTSMRSYSAMSAMLCVGRASRPRNSVCVLTPSSW